MEMSNLIKRMFYLFGHTIKRGPHTASDNPAAAAALHIPSPVSRAVTSTTITTRSAFQDSETSDTSPVAKWQWHWPGEIKIVGTREIEML